MPGSYNKLLNDGGVASMSWTFTTSGSAIIYAGANVNSTIATSGSALLSFSNDAEGYICGVTRRDWLTYYAQLKAPIQQLLTAAANEYIALQMIAYDMSGYTSRLEAENMLDMHFDKLQSMITSLQDIKTGTLLPPPVN